MLLKVVAERINQVFHLHYLVKITFRLATQTISSLSIFRLDSAAQARCLTLLLSVIVLVHDHVLHSLRNFSLHSVDVKDPRSNRIPLTLTQRRATTIGIVCAALGECDRDEDGEDDEE